MTLQEQALVQKAVDETIHYSDKALLALESSFLETAGTARPHVPANEPYAAKVAEYMEQMGYGYDYKIK